MAVPRMQDENGCYVKLKADLAPAARYLNDALQYAVQTDNKDQAILLINQGADLKWGCKKTLLTPLMIALRLEHIETFKLLLEHGADPADCFDWMVQSCSAERPDYTLMGIIRKHPETLIWMFDHGVDQGKHCSKKSWFKFVSAITRCRASPQLFKVLLKYIPPAQFGVSKGKLQGHVFDLNKSNDLRFVMLFNAIGNESKESVELLVKDEKVPVNVLQQYRLTAVADGIAYFDYHTPLHHAVQCECLEMVKCVLTNGAKFVSCESTMTPLDTAYNMCSPEIVEFFLSNGFTSVSTRRYKLHVACLLQQIDQVQALIYDGANVNEVDDSGVTPLVLSIQMKNIVLVKLLVKSGAELEPLDRKKIFSRHPIYHAILSKDVEILRFLLDKLYGTSSLKDMFPDSQRLLITAAIHSDLKCFNLLMERDADYVTKYNDLAPIHAAALRGNLQMLRSIAEKGVCVNRNAASSWGMPLDSEEESQEVDRRPLVLCKNAECISYLLEMGANMHSIGIAEYAEEQLRKNGLHILKKDIMRDLIKLSSGDWDARVEPCPPYMRLVEAGNIEGLKAYFNTEQGKTLREASFVFEQACLVGQFKLVKILLKENPTYLMQLEDLELLFHKYETDFFDFGCEDEEKDAKIKHDHNEHIQMIALLFSFGCTFHFKLKRSVCDEMEDLYMSDEEEESDGEEYYYDYEYDSDDHRSEDMKAKDYAADFLNLIYPVQRFVCVKLLQEMCGRNLIIKSKLLLRSFMIDGDYDIMRLIRVCGHRIAGKSFAKLGRLMEDSEHYSMFEEFEEKAYAIKREPLDLQSMCRIKIRSQIFEQMTEYSYINHSIQKLPLAKPVLEYVGFTGKHEHSYLWNANENSFPVSPPPASVQRQRRVYDDDSDDEDEYNNDCCVM